MPTYLPHTAEQRLKNAIYRVAEGVGVNRAARRRLRNRLLVLCYHAVVPDDTPDDPRTTIAVTCGQFEAQLRELRRHWYPVDQQDVLAACEDSAQLPRNAVLLTFDDGFRNNLEYAAPLLKHYDVPAVFFITSGLIGARELLWTHEITERVVAWPEYTLPTANGEGPAPVPPGTPNRFSLARRVIGTCKVLPDARRRDYLDILRAHEMECQEKWQSTLYAFMSWAEVRELADQGFAIGAHTVDHPILANIAEPELRRQLYESKQMIESQLQRPCIAVAYPNGGESDYSPEVIHAAQEGGYRLGYTLRQRRNPRNLAPMEIDRVCVTRDVPLGLFQARTAGWR